MIVRWEIHPTGRRCYVGHARIHHGLAGIVLMAIGAALIWHDRTDAPWLADR